MKRYLPLFILLLLLCSWILSSCGTRDNATAGSSTAETVPSDSGTGEITSETPTDSEKAEEHMGILTLQIGGRTIPVTWEENESTAELKRQAAKGNITIPLSPYSGFEQVGSLGRTYPASDVRQTAENGDIMLYASSNVVLFYGSNTWAYTKLGHIDLPADEITALLGGDAVTVSFILNYPDT